MDARSFESLDFQRADRSYLTLTESDCLSYAAKRGCSFEGRLSLGYHTHTFKMALCYSRDGAARPLQVLEQFLREVREKIFNPDDTGSGRLRMTQSLGSDLHKTATET